MNIKLIELQLRLKYKKIDWLTFYSVLLHKQVVTFCGTATQKNEASKKNQKKFQMKQTDKK